MRLACARCIPPLEPENDSPLIDKDTTHVCPVLQLHPTLRRHERPLEPCWREGGCPRHRSTVLVQDIGYTLPSWEHTMCSTVILSESL